MTTSSEPIGSQVEVSWPAKPPLPPLSVVVPEPDTLPPGWIKLALRRGGVELLNVALIDAIIPAGVGGTYEHASELIIAGEQVNVELGPAALIAHIAAAEGGLAEWLEVPLVTKRSGFVRGTRIWRMRPTPRANFEPVEAGAPNNRPSYDLCLPLGGIVRVPDSAGAAVCRLLSELLTTLERSRSDG